MRNRTRMIAAVTAVTAAVAAGSSVAAAASGAKPDAHAQTVSVAKTPGAPSGTQGQDGIVAAVAGELHVSATRVGAALQPLFAAGQADTASPVFAAAARSLDVSVPQLAAALAQAKQSLAGGS